MGLKLYRAIFPWFSSQHRQNVTTAALARRMNKGRVDEVKPSIGIEFGKVVLSVSAVNR